MTAYNWARHSLPVLGFALVALVAQPANAQSSAPPVAGSQAVGRDTTSTFTRIDTVRVTAKRRSWWRRESDLAAGNRFLEKELARYDKRIVELEKKLDSLRLVAAARWKEARDLEAAAVVTRERRNELERRVVMLESADSVRVRSAAAAPGPR